MNVLIACEESQRVCCAFRNKGHDAFSCDLQTPSGGHPEWHILGDAVALINGYCRFETMDGQFHSVSGKWDLIIAHPPCTYLTKASAVRMRIKGEINKDRYKKAMEGKELFSQFLNADCPKIAVENPVPMKMVGLPPCSQIIEPYEFGHPYSKKTCLWLKNLPPLMPTEIIVGSGVVPYVNGGCKNKDGSYRRFTGRRERDMKSRSKTFDGIAEAMAEQWGRDHL